jgi:hypothetical protein
MYEILRQAVGVVIGGLIVAAITLAPRVSANDEITVASLHAPVTIDESAQTDKRMTYQGMLLNASGQPVQDGSYTMTFSIYDSSTGGLPLWSYEFNAGQGNGVIVTNGLFTVLLPVGKDGNAESSIFTGKNLWLGVRVEGDAEATPRQPLLYVPYAYWARNADSLGGKGSRYLPVAYGIIDRETGGVVNGSGNFTSEWVDEKDNVVVDYYEITIDGVNYNLNEYVTVVTAISQKECPQPTVGRTNSNAGRLLVEMEDRNGVNVQCKFHFVTFRP